VVVRRHGHDLRGVLSPALLVSERLQASADPSVRRAGDIVAGAVERATELLGKVVEFVREDVEPAAPARQRIALRPAVESAAQEARASCPGLAVHNGVGEDAVGDAEADALRRVLANLLQNAGEAGARTARITAEAGHNATTLTVSDDGPGLPDAVRERPFRPFVGGGLGLAIARDLMLAQHGDIALERTGPEGTAFRVVVALRSAGAWPTVAAGPGKAGDTRTG